MQVCLSRVPRKIYPRGVKSLRALCVIALLTSLSAECRAARSKPAEDLERLKFNAAVDRTDDSSKSDLSATLVATAGFASVIYLAAGDEDEEISLRLSQEESPFDRGASRFGRSLGEPALNFGTLSAIGTYGWLQGDRRARGCCLDGFAAAALGEGLFVPTLKVLLGRRRPNAGLGAHSYDMVDGGQSLPSGHTALAFSLAGTIHSWYPDWRGWTAIALASSTAYSRVHTLAHWPSDVVAGALIGFGTAHWVAQSRLRAKLPDVLPIFTREYTGASVQARF